MNANSDDISWSIFGVAVDQDRRELSEEGLAERMAARSAVYGRLSGMTEEEKLREFWPDHQNLSDHFTKPPQSQFWINTSDGTYDSYDNGGTLIEFVNPWLNVDLIQLASNLSYSDYDVEKPYWKFIKILVNNRKTKNSVYSFIDLNNRFPGLTCYILPEFERLTLRITVGKFLFGENYSSYEQPLNYENSLLLHNKITEFLNYIEVNDIFDPGLLSVTKIEMFRDMIVPTDLIKYYCKYLCHLPITSSYIRKSKYFENTCYRERRHNSGITIYVKDEDKNILRVEARYKKSGEIKYQSKSFEVDKTIDFHYSLSNIITNQRDIFPIMFNSMLKQARIPDDNPVIQGCNERVIDLINKAERIHAPTKMRLKNIVANPPVHQEKAPKNATKQQKGNLKLHRDKYRRDIQSIEKIIEATPALGICEGPALPFGFLYIRPGEE